MNIQHEENFGRLPSDEKREAHIRGPFISHDEIIYLNLAVQISLLLAASTWSNSYRRLPRNEFLTQGLTIYCLPPGLAGNSQRESLKLLNTTNFSLFALANHIIWFV